MEGVKVMAGSPSRSVDDGSSCDSAINIEGKLTVHMGGEGAQAAARSNPSRSGYENGGGGIIRSRSERGKEEGGIVWFGKPVLSYWVLIAISATVGLVGGSAGALSGRYYFVHGGADKWIYTWLQTAGCPVLIIPAAILAAARYKSRRSTAAGSAKSPGPGDVSRRRLLMWSLLIGIVMGVVNLLYSWGLAYLPVSTNTLLYATQLAFNISSSYALLRSRLTGWTVNAAVIITTSAVLLGLQSSADRPPKTTGRQYAIGFVTTLLASALYGFMLSLTELAYAHIGKPSKPGKQTGSVSFILVIYLQLGSSIVSTLFAMVGMVAADSFSTMQTEYQNFDAGRGAYVATLLVSALSWQAFFLGVFGVISLSSSLLSCLFTTATLPVVPILAVFFFHDSFNAVKGVSTFLAMWGFMSYIYGGFLDSQTSAQHTIDTDGTIELISASPTNPGEQKHTFTYNNLYS